MIHGEQHTIAWHVNIVKSSHIDKKVNDKFLHCLKAIYTSDGIGELKASRGPRYDYLAMILDYSTPGQSKIDMRKYVHQMLQEFPVKLIGVSKCGWTEDLLKVDETAI